ncbi:LD-carboxypeptidase [Candidatus Peribacteria bacterium]|nr:LD-carboxypeptidase [Candidatus Peribacteria bacterium]
MIAPKPIKKGDTIGIVSPSSPIAAFCPRRFERGVNHLKELGFDVKVGKYATSRYKHTAGTIVERVEDLHLMFSDPDIHAIICTIGGFNSHQLLEKLDFDLIKENPKIFMGYSDIVALLNVITDRTGMITYHGPALLPQFAEYGGVLSYTWKYFQDTVMSAENEISILSSKEWTDELTRWDEADDRKRKMKKNTGMKVLKPGKAEGKLWGGNAGTLLLLAGTPFFPHVKGGILCIEEDEAETPATIDRFFTQLRHMGIYDRINGILIGRCHSSVGLSADDSLEDIVRIATDGYDFPIVFDVDFGHTDPMITIPIGGNCKIDATDNISVVFRNA